MCDGLPPAVRKPAVGLVIDSRNATHLEHVQQVVALSLTAVVALPQDHVQKLACVAPHERRHHLLFRSLNIHCESRRRAHSSGWQEAVQGLEARGGARLRTTKSSARKVSRTHLARSTTGTTCALARPVFSHVRLCQARGVRLNAVVGKGVRASFCAAVAPLSLG